MSNEHPNIPTDAFITSTLDQYKEVIKPVIRLMAALQEVVLDNGLSQNVADALVLQLAHNSGFPYNPNANDVP